MQPRSLKVCASFRIPLRFLWSGIPVTEQVEDPFARSRSNPPAPRFPADEAVSFNRAAFWKAADSLRQQMRPQTAMDPGKSAKIKGQRQPQSFERSKHAFWWKDGNKKGWNALLGKPLWQSKVRDCQFEGPLV